MARGWMGALALAAAVVAAPAGAQLLPSTFTGGTTGDLAKLCAAEGGDALSMGARGWCEGFMVGAGQFHRSITAQGGRIRPLYCLPDDPSLTIDKVRLAFVAWVAANPGAAGERAVDGAMRFANATYPCPTRAGGKR
jgi:hypothetical protein